MKTEGVARGFYCFQVFGVSDKTRETRAWSSFSNEYFHCDLRCFYCSNETRNNSFLIINGKILWIIISMSFFVKKIGQTCHSLRMAEEDAKSRFRPAKSIAEEITCVERQCQRRPRTRTNGLWVFFENGSKSEIKSGQALTLVDCLKPW